MLSRHLVFSKHIYLNFISNWLSILPILEVWKNYIAAYTWRIKTRSALRFEINNTLFLLLILVTIYSNLKKKNSLHQSLIMVSKNIIDSFGIEMQSLSCINRLAMTNLSTTCWKKEKKSILKNFKYPLIKTINFRIRE